VFGKQAAGRPTPSIVRIGIGVNFADPRRVECAAAGAPTGWQVRDFQNRGIHFGDFQKTDNDRIRDLRITPPEKLPAVIVCIVRDTQDRLVSCNNLPERKNGTIRGLVKGPVFHLRTYFEFDANNILREIRFGGDRSRLAMQ
jgi:hypothetical protein